MRILYLAPDLFTASGGISRYCRLVVKALAESPLVEELDVAALQDPRGSQPDPRYWQPNKDSYFAAGGDRVAFSREVTRRVLSKPYSHVLSGHVYLTPLPFLMRPWIGLEKLLTFVYGLDATARLPWFRRLPLAKSRQVIAISSYTAALMAQANGVREDRIRILHNCLDPVFSLSTAAADPAPLTVPTFPPNSILTVSRLSRADAYKGHRAMLMALAMVLARIPDSMYYIVGQGELRGELERHASSLGIAQNVKFVGAVSDAELARCYDMADVFAMPSKGEGFGFVFLEAMARGRPVVAGNRDAAGEVIGNNEAGLLVDPDDVEQIGTALTKLLLNPELRQRLGAVGRKRAAQYFGFDFFKARLESYLLEFETRGGLLAGSTTPHIQAVRHVTHPAETPTSADTP